MPMCVTRRWAAPTGWPWACRTASPSWPRMRCSVRCWARQTCACCATRASSNSCRPSWRCTTWTWCWLASQHQVQVVQRQLGLQLFELALVAQQAQVWRAQHRTEQRMRGQLGDAVRQAHGQPVGAAHRRVTHIGMQALADAENLFGARERRLPGFGEREAPPLRLEQLMAKRLFQLLHLGADGLNGHVQPLGGAGEATRLGHNPEVVQMAVVQCRHDRNRRGRQAGREEARVREIRTRRHCSPASATRLLCRKYAAGLPDIRCPATAAFEPSTRPNFN